MPNLVEAYAKYKNKNFEIVGVSLDQSADAWKEAIKKLNITWPQMSDLKYWNCEGAQLYAVISIPHTVLIDEAARNRMELIVRSLAEQNGVVYPLFWNKSVLILHSTL